MSIQLLRLNEILKERGIIRGDMAQMVGVSRNSMNLICTGKTWPRPELLLAISKALDVDIRELFHPTKEGKERLEIMYKDPETGIARPIDDLVR